MIGLCGGSKNKAGRRIVRRGVLSGAAAGAAGVTALNAVTYLDMLVRGRGTSRTPEDTVEALAARAHLAIPGGHDTRANRVAGLGPLIGLFTGIGVGALFGVVAAAGWRPRPVVAALVAGGAAMAASDLPMTALGVTDPASWAAKDWAADVIPHLAYGAVTAAVTRATQRR